MMRIDNLRPAPGSKRGVKRVGRGYSSGHGGHSACRGTKGQNARSGVTVRPGFEGGQTPFWMRFPKRGFTNPLKPNYAEVNLADLELRFQAGEEVTPEVLLERKVIKAIQDGVKILGHGTLTKALVVKAHAFSRSAQEKIEKAGGQVHVLGTPKEG